MNEEFAEVTQEPAPDKYEAEAVKYGWKPAAEWDGEGHMSAEKFMTKGPGTSRKLAEKVEQLERKLTETDAQYSERLRRNEQAIQAAAEARLQARISDIESAKRRAVETGDVARYEALEQEKQQVVQQESPRQEDGPSEEDSRAMGAWIAAHPDYRSNKTYQAEIDKLWNRAMGYGIKDVPSVLKFIDDNYKAPVKAERTAAAVDGGGIGAAVGGKKNGWSSIPAEDRKEAARFIADGTFDDLAEKMKTTPEEAYAAKYWEQDDE